MCIFHGPCEDEKVGGDAEAAAREGEGEAGDESHPAPSTPPRIPPPAPHTTGSPFPHLYKCGNGSGGGLCGIIGAKKGFLWEW